MEFLNSYERKTPYMPRKKRLLQWLLIVIKSLNQQL